MYAFFCAEKYTELELVSINIFQDHMLKMLYYMVLQNWEKVLFQYGKRLAILKILCTMLSDFPANCGEDPPGAGPAGPDPGSARFFRAMAACAARPHARVSGKPARYDDPIVVIGASEFYEARCRQHHEVPRD